MSKHWLVLRAGPQQTVLNNFYLPLSCSVYNRMIISERIVGYMLADNLYFSRLCENICHAESSALIIGGASCSTASSTTRRGVEHLIICTRKVCVTDLPLVTHT